MAKKKPATLTSKSDLVREYLDNSPAASIEQIVTDLKPHGISEALAKKIKYKERRGAKRGRRKTARRRAAAAATSAAGETKADQIRDVARSLGTPVRPRDVTAALREKGIEASSSQVSVVLRKMGLRRRRRGRRAKVAAGAARTAVTAEKWSLDVLVQAKRLAEQLGGIDKAREALAALAKLS